MIKLSFTDTDPKRASLVVNAIVDAYVEFNKTRKNMVTSSAVSWLAKKLKQTK